MPSWTRVGHDFWGLLGGKTQVLKMFSWQLFHFVSKSVKSSKIWFLYYQNAFRGFRKIAKSMKKYETSIKNWSPRWSASWHRFSFDFCGSWRPCWPPRWHQNPEKIKTSRPLRRKRWRCAFLLEFSTVKWHSGTPQILCLSLGILMSNAYRRFQLNHGFFSVLGANMHPCWHLKSMKK